MINELHFIFSAISFLQLYLPIVNLGNKNNIQSIFYIRSNIKQYACPITNKENSIILNKAINKYCIIKKDINEIKTLSSGELPSCTSGNSVLFVVDGDIYGPNEKNKAQSVLFNFNLSKNIKIISLCEHLNFLWAYHKFIDRVNYVIFPNKIVPEFYNLINHKNIFLGNTKFDDLIENNDDIYKKYKINKDDKYILFLFPKSKYIQSYNIKPSHIINLYNHFKKLNYKIILKTRPKDIILENCKGDYNIISDTYPNETLELMKISDICILFSSSAIDECVMMEIPCIDFIVDNEIVKRYEYLYNDKIIKQVKDWKNINIDSIINIINSLDKKNSLFFKEMKEKYLYLHMNTSEQIINFIKNKIN